MSKSYVTMEQNICPICGITHDTGNILMDKKLKDTFEHKTITGFSLCAECKEKEPDYIALIEIDEKKSSKPFNPSNVYRTGNLAHLKREVFNQIFDQTCPDLPFIYVETGLIARLQG